MYLLTTYINKTQKKNYIKKINFVKKGIHFYVIKCYKKECHMVKQIICLCILLCI